LSYQKAFILDPKDLLNLWCHYTDGGVPLDGEVKSVGFNPYLERFVGIEVESDEWQTQEPLHLRYEGKKVLSWTKGQDSNSWAKTPDTPKIQ
jgi:hypothetical protein